MHFHTDVWLTCPVYSLAEHCNLIPVSYMIYWHRPLWALSLSLLLELCIKWWKDKQYPFLQDFRRETANSKCCFSHVVNVHKACFVHQTQGLIFINVCFSVLCLSKTNCLCHKEKRETFKKHFFTFSTLISCTVQHIPTYSIWLM